MCIFVSITFNLFNTISNLKWEEIVYNLGVFTALITRNLDEKLFTMPEFYSHHAITNA